MFLVWVKFIVVATMVAISGYRICIYAEKIAKLTKISRSFAGLVLLAAITSLPELVVTVSATNI